MLPDKVRNISQHLPERVQQRIGKDVLAQIEEQSEYDRGQLQTLAQFCKGKDSCQYGQECPIKDPTVGQRCQLELYYSEKWFNDYVESYNVEPSDRKLQQLIVSLVQVDIQLMRQQQIIQHDGFEQYIVTETEAGDRKFDKKLHNVLTLVNQLEDRRTKIMKQLSEFVQSKQTQDVIGDIAQLLSYKDK